MSYARTFMQELPVANLGYLCPSLWGAEYELHKRKKEKEIVGVRCLMLKLYLKLTGNPISTLH